MNKFNIEWYTETGLRQENQDNASYMKNKNGYYMVTLADGMGGHYGGKMASEKAIQLIRSQFESFNIDSSIENDPDDFIITWLKTANSNINDEFKVFCEKNPSYNDMGTTLVIGIIFKDNIYVSNVGDSRLYVFEKNNHNLNQITRDQNLQNKFLLNEETSNQDTIDFTKDLNISFFQNILYSSIGNNKKTIIDIYKYPINENSVVVLTSDGVHDYIDIKTFTKLLDQNNNLKIKAKGIVEAAFNTGSQDNLTILLLECYK